MSDIRKDLLSNTWVIIAPQRVNRPHFFEKETDSNKLENCPFCEDELLKSQIAPYATCAATFDKNGNWITRVIDNKFPALEKNVDLRFSKKEDIYEKLNGFGGHEILVESPIHIHYNWASMPVEQFESIFEMYKCRYEFWKKKKKITYLSIFKNQGKEAGASIKHPHSQMIATPIIPSRIKDKMHTMNKYYDQNEKCLLCEIIKNEKKVKKRLIMEDENFLIFSNYAPRFPYETLIVPKAHQSSFEKINKNEIKSLANLTSSLFKKFEKLLPGAPFNLILHVSPFKVASEAYFHWHIEIIFRISQPAGFEWGSGIYINSYPPEDTAEQIRNI